SVRRIAPRVEVDLAEAIAADVGLGIHQRAETADVLLHPAEVAFASPLVAEGEDDLRLAAGLGDRARVGDGIGDRLVEESRLAGARRREGGLEVHRVRRGVDDRVDPLVGKDRFVRRRGLAAVLGGEFLALFLRAAVAGGDLELAGALDRVGKHVGPPAHADTTDFHLIASAASRATFSSNSQLPPATPTPP